MTGVFFRSASVCAPFPTRRSSDLALFTAKNTGKNKTVVYTPKLYAKGKKGLKEDFGEAAPGALIASLNQYSGQADSAYTATLYALTAAIDTMDRFTFSHSQNVARYASAPGAKLGMDPVHISIISEAGLLHDIGKIGIPEHILAKSEPLTMQEYTIMQQHVIMLYRQSWAIMSVGTAGAIRAG